MVRRAIIAAAMVASLAAAGCVEVEDIAESIAQLRAEDGSGVCTSFSINAAAGYWVTAGHCATGNHGLEVVKSADAATDLVIFKSSSAPALRLAGSGPRLRQPVISVGFPAKNANRLLLYFWGHVSNARTKVNQDGVVREVFVIHEGGGPGMSGAPIFDSSGRVVGVVIGGAQFPSVIVTGVRLETLRKFTAGFWEGESRSVPAEGL